MGAYSLANYFYRANYDLGDLLQGIGFLLAAPQAYLSPEKFLAPLRVRNFKPHLSSFVDWLTFVGCVFLIVGLVVKWL